MKNLPLFLLLLTSIFLTACKQNSPIPKPRAFPKIDFPERNYQDFEEGYCSFTFSYPSYTEIQQDSLFFQEKPLHPCWFDLFYPAFDSRIHFSYYPIGSEDDLEQLKQDAFELVDYHNKKANYIDEILVTRPEAKVHGFVFDINGPAASPFQFFLTDSTQHFLRGALYFNTKIQPDSLAPLYDFVKEDIIKMIETLEWAD